MSAGVRDVHLVREGESGMPDIRGTLPGRKLMAVAWLAGVRDELDLRQDVGRRRVERPQKIRPEHVIGVEQSFPALAQIQVYIFQKKVGHFVTPLNLLDRESPGRVMKQFAAEDVQVDPKLRDLGPLQLE